MQKNYTTVIGLEVHVQLKTNSKMFCRCSNTGETLSPNTTVCPICVGHPGTLPVLNKTAVDYGVKTALALHCDILSLNKFDRKNYFYPDLPKGYQISQYDLPLATGGYVDIVMPVETVKSGRENARIRIRRLHLEEDAAKLMHSETQDTSLVDFNRSSTPLAEIVTEPDFRSSEEAIIFLQELRLLFRSLGVSSADMEKGNMRCDANVSLEFEHHGSTVRTPISEIKNLNSFRSVQRALDFESNRLYSEWMSDGDIRNRTHKITVGWDDANGSTILQRWKEEAHDYRYFPDPDLPPLYNSTSDIELAKALLPELPQQKRKRFREQYGIPQDSAVILCEDPSSAAFFEQSASELDEWLQSFKNPKEDTARDAYRVLASWFINKFTYNPLTRVTPENFGQLIALIISKKITSTAAQEVLLIMNKTAADPVAIMKEKNLEQVSDIDLLAKACDEAITKHPDACENYRNGKSNAIMFLVGVVMREMRSKANPDLVREILEKKITNKS